MPKSKAHRRKIIDGVTYRLRRGSWVPIPEEWVGNVTHRQTIIKRNSISKRTRKENK